MKIHKQFKVPWLSYPVPFAVGPSKHSGKFISYTLRGTPGAIATAWLLSLCFVVGAFGFIYLVGAHGLWGFFVYKGVPIPVFGYGIGQIFLFVSALFLFRSGTYCQQIVIDTESFQAQIRNKRKGAGPVSLASISLQSVTIVRLSVLNSWKSVKTDQKMHAVFLHVGEDAEVLGVFVEESIALQFVEQLKTETSLPILPAQTNMYSELAGYMNLTKGRSYKRADTMRVYERSLEPIGFIEPTV